MNIDDRMKRYESVFDGCLTRRMPVIGRIDGKAFHSFTRGMQKPFDADFQTEMLVTAEKLCEQIDGCRLAYIQSDEINLLLVDYNKLDTEAWFDYRINKMCSVAAGIASSYMSRQYNKQAIFDARFFNVPKEDVCNYFVWRQRDAVKNSINSYAQSMFSQKQLNGLHGGQLQELMWSQKDFNWNDAPIINKRGACVRRLPKIVAESDGWGLDVHIPEFSKDRDFIERLLLTEEERMEQEVIIKAGGVR